jgi:hypothetical protein
MPSAGTAPLGMVQLENATLEHKDLPYGTPGGSSKYRWRRQASNNARNNPFLDNWVDVNTTPYHRSVVEDEIQIAASWSPSQEPERP